MSDGLTLKNIRLRAVQVPMQRPLLTRILEIRQVCLALIDLETDQGIVGRSYLFTFTPKGAAYLAPLFADLSEDLKGLTIEPKAVFQQVQKSLSLFGHSGIARMVVSGLDMAVWDAYAQMKGKPLVTVLGGTPQPVRAYNSNGLGLMAADAAAREAETLLADGNFNAVKIRFGRQTLAEDAQVYRAVRQAVGDEIIIPCDFNQGLSPAEAVHRCQAIDDWGLYWIEEPVVYDDFSTYAAIVQASQTPIQLGENFYNAFDLENAIRAKACDFVMPDLERIGGVSGWLEAAQIAGNFNIPFSSHLYPEFSAHLMPLTPTAHWLEYVNWANPILQTPIEIKNGSAIIPDAPGANIEWDESAVKKYQLT